MFSPRWVASAGATNRGLLHRSTRSLRSTPLVPIPFPLPYVPECPPRIGTTLTVHPRQSGRKSSVELGRFWPSGQSAVQFSWALHFRNTMGPMNLQSEAGTRICDGTTICPSNVLPLTRLANRLHRTMLADRVAQCTDRAGLDVRGQTRRLSLHCAARWRSRAGVQPQRQGLDRPRAG
jgi:hypothetical protein